MKRRDLLKSIAAVAGATVVVSSVPVNPNPVIMPVDPPFSPKMAKKGLMIAEMGSFDKMSAKEILDLYHETGVLLWCRDVKYYPIQNGTL